MHEPGRSPVRWSSRIFGSRAGQLTLTDSELSLSAGDQTIFSVPRGVCDRFEWPWYGFGASFKVHTAGKRYFVTFVPRAASFGTWSVALLEGSDWRTRLTPCAAHNHRLANVAWLVVLIMKLLLAACAILLGFGMAVDPAGNWPERAFGILVCVAFAVSGLMVWKDARTSR